MCNIKTIKSIGVTSLIVLIIFTYIVQIAKVPTSSMNPTIKPNSTVIVQKIFYGEILDAVVMVYVDDLDMMVVKRVVGVGGDSLSVKDGLLYRNEELVKPVHKVDYKFEDFVVPQNDVFLLGDNRNNSIDSHVFGSVSESEIKGKIIYIF